MDFMKLRFYLEILSIAVGIVLIISILPIQIFIHGNVRPLTIFSGTFLWYTIIFHNFTFKEFMDKWFKH